MKYIHDCSKCVPLGPIRDYDLSRTVDAYYCKQGEEVFFVLRHGSEPSQNSSVEISIVRGGVANGSLSLVWKEALRRYNLEV